MVEDEIQDGTGTDLGDDLIEKTRSLTRETVARDAIRPDQLDDHLDSARILFGEGLIEEAKKILHRILICDAGHVLARQMLQEVHELELKQIFSEGGGRRIPGIREPRNVLPAEVDVEQVMRELDRDLKLDIFPFDRDERAIREYGERLDQEVSGLSPRDLVDLGIAFLEMGLSEIAVPRFRNACQKLLQESDQKNRDLLLSATSLHAYSLILVGQAFEATLELQSVLRDSEIPIGQKVEFFYLMGRAHEEMKKTESALGWYQQVAAIDSRYRDVEDRLRGKRRR